MSFAVALISLALFVAAFRVAKIVPMASQAIARARTAAAVLGDRSKTEDEKERMAREMSVALFGNFLAITALTALALVPSAACLFLAAWAGFAAMPDMLNALVSVPLIGAACLFFAVDYMIHR